MVFFHEYFWTHGRLGLNMGSTHRRFEPWCYKKNRLSTREPSICSFKASLARDLFALVMPSEDSWNSSLPAPVVAPSTCSKNNSLGLFNSAQNLKMEQHTFIKVLVFSTARRNLWWGPHCPCFPRLKNSFKFLSRVHLTKTILQSQ